MGKLGKAAASTLAAVLLVPSVAGCAGGHKAPSVPVAETSAATPEKLTPDVATQAFSAYVNSEDVARASGDERLALSLVSDGQSLLTAAEFRSAVFTGDPVTRYTYGAPHLYVPRLTTYPQWFVASVDRTAAGQKSKQAVWMGFVRPSVGARWKLSLAAGQLAPAAPKAKAKATATSSPSPSTSPSTSGSKIKVDAEGYATPLATYDNSLVIQPKSLPAIQATLAEEGSDNNLAARVMAPGPYTTDYYTKTQADKKAAAGAGLALDTVFTATAYPIFPLATTDGGGFVLYALTRNTVTYVKKKSGHLPPPARDVASLLDSVVLEDQLQVWETLQFATADPPVVKTKNATQPKAAIVGAAHGVTSAITQKTS